MAGNQSNLQRLGQQHLQEKELSTLNRILEFLAARLARLEGATVKGPATFEYLSTEDTEIPSDKSRVLNLGVAEKLFSPQVIADAFFNRSWQGRYPVLPPASGDSYVWSRLGTHEERATQSASALRAGTLWFETDRTSLYQIQEIDGAKQWQWIDGLWSSQLSDIPALGEFDAGFLFEITTGTGGIEYYHTARWNGTQWEAVGEWGKYVGYFAGDPISKGWQLCDGTATKYLDISAGSVVEVSHTAVDERGGVYRKGGSAYSAVVALPQAPSITGSIDAALTGVTLGSIGAALTGISIDASSSMNVVGAAGATNLGSVAPGGHTHSVSDPGHTHSGGSTSDPGHTHGITNLEVDDTGEPLSITYKPYFRR